jgi:outer membrane immunogenic protein
MRMQGRLRQSDIGTGLAMKTILIATIALTVLAGGGVAAAADLDLQTKAPHRGCGGGAFQGIFVGIHGGGVNHTATRADHDDYLGGGNQASTYTLNATGGLIGGQAGYNYQCRDAVFGIEIDGSWMQASRSFRLFPNAGPPLATVTSRLDSLVTARARAGIVANGMLMIYVTGGIAAVQTRTTWAVAFPVPGGDESFPFKEWNWGWVAGFGVEWAATERLSLRSEVLYVGLGERDYTFNSALAVIPNNTVTHSDSIWVARIGANVRLTKD